MAGRTTTFRKRTSHGPRRAYILLIVLAFSALASSLGMSFLEANSTVMPEAVNYQGTIRAESLASSFMRRRKSSNLWVDACACLNPSVVKLSCFR